MTMVAERMDETMRVGLLMEAAQAQQALAENALDRLREHTTGLDAIVREEIRTTLLEELRTVAEETQSAAAALRKLQRMANLRLAAWGMVLPGLATLIPVVLGWWLLPSRGEIQSLAAQRDQLAMDISRLSRQGGKAELRHCGSAQRLCVHVDRSAPAYGAAGDFLVIKGY